PAETHTLSLHDALPILVSSLNPSTYGDQVTFTATVTAKAPSTLNPSNTGTVSFYDGTSVTPLCTSSLSGGSATCAVNYLDAAHSDRTSTPLNSSHLVNS